MCDFFEIGEYRQTYCTQEKRDIFVPNPMNHFIEKASEQAGIRGKGDRVNKRKRGQNVSPYWRYYRSLSLTVSLNRCIVEKKLKSFYFSVNAILCIDGRSNEMVMLQIVETACQCSHTQLKSSMSLRDTLVANLEWPTTQCFAKSLATNHQNQ